MARPVTTSLLVDWNSQLLAIPDRHSVPLPQQARSALANVGRVVTHVLTRQDENTRFAVSLRLYCGWTQSCRPTPHFKALIQQQDLLDLKALFPSNRIAVSASIGYGHRLIDAMPHRLHNTLGIHLPNTLRRRRGELAEKMVDTALASDLLSIAKSDPGSMIIVVSNDDDLIPPVFTAEAWMQPAGGRVMLVRPPRESDLQLAGLTKYLESGS